MQKSFGFALSYPVTEIIVVIAVMSVSTHRLCSVFQYQTLPLSRQDLIDFLYKIKQGGEFIGRSSQKTKIQMNVYCYAMHVLNVNIFVLYSQCPDLGVNFANCLSSMDGHLLLITIHRCEIVSSLVPPQIRRPIYKNMAVRIPPLSVFVPRIPKRTFSY